MPNCEVAMACAGDAQAIADIYNHYVLETLATFEEVGVAPRDMAARMATARAAGLPWYVAEQAGEVVGYSCSTRWKTRSAYCHSAETGLYLAHAATGHGIGGRLYRTLLDALDERGVHAVIAGIALPNPARIALHEKCGFEKIGRLREVGFKFGRWIDVGYWERVNRQRPAKPGRRNPV